MENLLVKNNYKENLGRKTWDFLHEFANVLFYIKLKGVPITFDEDYNNKLYFFLKDLADLYPCAKCRIGFKLFVNDYNKNILTRNQFKQFICNMHNKVNLKLGKPEYSCKRI